MTSILVFPSLFNKITIFQYFSKDFFDVCEIYSLSITIYLWAKASCRFLMALIRYFYIEKPHLIKELDSNAILCLAFGTQIFILTFAIFHQKVIDLTLGFGIKKAFCYGTSPEFAQIWLEFEGKRKYGRGS